MFPPAAEPTPASTSAPPPLFTRPVVPLSVPWKVSEDPAATSNGVAKAVVTTKALGTTVTFFWICGSVRALVKLAVRLNVEAASRLALALRMAIASSFSLLTLKVAACAMPLATRAAPAITVPARRARRELLRAPPPRGARTFSAAATHAPSAAFQTVL
jgi:hypothetical protein